jgi:hypothetical protein
VPSVNDPNHSRLEADVKHHLSECGFLVDDATYHNNMDPAVVRRLQYMDNPTSLYCRGRADRIAIHTRHPVCFEWECKTKSEYRHDKPDAFIEALPVAHHILKARLGVRILYVYRDDYMPLEVGIWADDLMGTISEVRITPRARAIAGLSGYLRGVFGDKCRDTHGRGGSGDAYCVIERRNLEGDWRDEVSSELEPFANGN